MENEKTREQAKLILSRLAGTEATEHGKGYRAGLCDAFRYVELLAGANDTSWVDLLSCVIGGKQEAEI